jgi:hypothetical protein
MIYLEIPLYIRLMSLFCVFIPPFLIYGVIRSGYDRLFLILRLLITWFILPLSYFLAYPERNINWIWRPFGVPQTIFAFWIYFVILMVVYPLLLYLPTHGLVPLAFRRKRASTNS